MPFRTTAGPERRRPIADLGAWFDDLDEDARPVLRALGELLTGVTDREQPETAERFTARSLGVADYHHLIDESRYLAPVSKLTTAVALGELIEHHADRCTLGPGEDAMPPRWTQTEVGGRRYRHPLCLRVYFPPGALVPDAGCVIFMDAREDMLSTACVSVYVAPHAQHQARAVLDHLEERANALNPYRGRAVRATVSDGLVLTVIELPPVSRDDVVVGRDVWVEIDLGVTAVRDRHAVLNAHGLGARRGVLLCGPPGTGKSAVSAVVANELVGDFTVIYVEAKAGAKLLSSVVRESQRFGGPVLLILEDVDLWCRDRSVDGGGLSELLQAMDISSDARILTLASTNDVATLDKAAIRTGRFDSIVEVGYPDRADAARILAALVAKLDGGDGIDIAAVVVALPARTSGSDLREIVRRAVLAAGDGALSTAVLLEEARSGRYLAEVPAGLYL